MTALAGDLLALVRSLFMRVINVLQHSSFSTLVNGEQNSGGGGGGTPDKKKTTGPGMLNRCLDKVKA